MANAWELYLRPDAPLAEGEAEGPLFVSWA
jgi:hypothetical protein